MAQGDTKSSSNCMGNSIKFIYNCKLTTACLVVSSDTHGKVVGL
jgi:hypothetical protein